MQNVVVWNSIGFVDVTRSHFLFWFSLGLSTGADNKDFWLVTLLQGRVPKARTNLAKPRDYKSKDLGLDRVVDGWFGKAVKQPLKFLLDFTKRESGLEGLWSLCLGSSVVRR